MTTGRKETQLKARETLDEQNTTELREVQWILGLIGKDYDQEGWRTLTVATKTFRELVLKSYNEYDDTVSRFNSHFIGEYTIVDLINALECFKFLI